MFQKHMNLKNSVEFIAIILRVKGPTEKSKINNTVNYPTKTALSWSIIKLHIMHKKMEINISQRQSSFHLERVSAYAVWTKKWFASKVCLRNITIKIIRMNMSALFKTID